MCIQQDDILIGILSVAGQPIYMEGPEAYSGPYQVIPDIQNDQILLTNNKSMEDDVTVFKIPYAEVSNISGKTVIIGD